MADKEVPGLQEWLDTVARELEVPDEAVRPGPLLNVARDVAHQVIRPGAPTSTYLIGVALGLQLAEMGADLDRDDVMRRLRELSEKVQDLATSTGEPDAS